MNIWFNYISSVTLNITLVILNLSPLFVNINSKVLNISSLALATPWDSVEQCSMDALSQGPKLHRLDRPFKTFSASPHITIVCI